MFENKQHYLNNLEKKKANNIIIKNIASHLCAVNEITINGNQLCVLLKEHRANNNEKAIYEWVRKQLSVDFDHITEDLIGQLQINFDNELCKLRKH